MSRTIKFRGKSEHSDEWCYGNLVDYGDGEMEIQGFDVFREGVDEWKEIKVIPETVGQFTGLHDANGQDIYEGDILRPYFGEKNLEVCFVNGGFVFRWLDNSGIFSPIEWVASVAYIIGNIHDNPELLK